MKQEGNTFHVDFMVYSTKYRKLIQLAGGDEIHKKEKFSCMFSLPKHRLVVM